MMWEAEGGHVVLGFEPSQAALSAMVNIIPGGGTWGLAAFHRWWDDRELIQDWFGMWQMGGPL
jgi:hypothetical protein